MVSASVINIALMPHVLQATTTKTVAEGAIPLLEAMGAMVVTTMVIMPMEEVATVATTVATVVLLQATMATVAMETALLVVSLLYCTGSLSACGQHELAQQQQQQRCLSITVQSPCNSPCCCKRNMM